MFFRIFSALSALFFFIAQSFAQSIADDNIVWTTPSRNSSESMPCGGGDIGLNVWVESGDLFVYLSRSGSFDENNQMLKLGRVRIHISPQPFGQSDFKQELHLESGDIRISSGGVAVKLWVDVSRPVVHIELNSRTPVRTVASYESWRFADRQLAGDELWATSYRKTGNFQVVTYRDNVSFRSDSIEFYHRNRSDITDVFNRTVDGEGMSAVKGEMFNPVLNRTSGGSLRAPGMVASTEAASGSYNGIPFRSWSLESRRPSTVQNIDIALHIAQTATMSEWRTGLRGIWEDAGAHAATAHAGSLRWWQAFWNHSYIYLRGPDENVRQAGRNYHLFRYMLAANAHGEFPTKFNGGLFTFDPVWVDPHSRYSPDFRRWGGGTMTAQNQRLVYYPLFRSGDFDMLQPQFDFYLRALHNAELRSRVYWHHAGASFTEQIENFGLPNLFEWGYNRPPEAAPGVERNPWLEYLWDTVLEFCSMMLDTYSYEGRNVHAYLPFIQSCLRFFDEHYRYLASAHGIEPLDADGHYILYPGSAAETFKMTYNSASTIAALKTVIDKLLQLPASYLSEEEHSFWTRVARQIPPLPQRVVDGHRMIAPALVWQRVQNVESPQLYPVFPWGLYGVGRPDIELARNTYLYDPYALKFRGYVGWKQDNIFAARLGLSDEAAALTLRKLADGPFRFPAFWGPGFDWAPDFNWGGTGALGLQEMLMQTVEDKIYLLPAWPANWSARFKLHAPQQTVVEGVVENGKLISVHVTPSSRRKDLRLPATFSPGPALP